MVGAFTRKEGKNREGLLERECHQCPYLMGMHSQAPAKNDVMAAGAWGMLGETRLVLLQKGQFGKGLQRASSGELKQELTTLNLKAKVEKGKGARRKGMLEKERQTWIRLLQGVTAFASMLKHADTGTLDRKGVEEIKLL